MRALGTIAVLALWALSRPYAGVVHDAVLYTARSLADRDPDGVGRDLIFLHDGQFGFSLFPPVLTCLAGSLGLAGASLLLVMASAVVWLTALRALVGRLATGRLMWAALVFVVIAPANYGGFGVLHFGEAFAVPRPFAEAGVLAGLAAGMAGKWVWALGLLGLAGLIHPIMALGGFAVALVMVCLERRRLLGLPAAVCLGVLLAAALDLPLAGRLFVVIDPVWRKALEADAFLFPRLWPLKDWATIITQTVTLSIAASLAQGRVRILFIATLTAGLGGFFVAWVFGDLYPSLLVVQIQPWRALWLVAVLSPAALIISLCSLWRGGAVARLALAFLLLGWLARTTPSLAIASSALAAVLYAAGLRSLFSLHRSFVVGVWVLVIGYAALHTITVMVFVASILAKKPADASLGSLPMLLLSTPLAAAAAVWALAERRRLAPVPAVLGTFAVVVLALALWDGRKAANSILDRGEPESSLTDTLRESPGEVFWLGSPQKAWAWAGRASWASYLQGGGMVFSRPLAMTLNDRMQRLVTLNLANERDVSPLIAGRPSGPLRPEKASFDQLCAAPDGPAWIVVPLDGRMIVPDDISAVTWMAPVPDHEPIYDEKYGLGWRKTESHAVLRCSKPAP